MPMDVLLAHFLIGISFGFILFLLATGLTLTMGLMRIVNLAHGALYMVGGYVGLSVARLTEDLVGRDMAFLLGILAGGLCAGLLGLIMETGFLRRLYKRELDQVLLTIGQAFTNHNGGQLAFGPDGYLYLGVGEGGLSKDPGPGSLLGKILRLDIDAEAPYAVPENNPFINQPDYRPEIWALGMRNPWRFSFDRLTQDLYIADVGQNLYEEAHYVVASRTAVTAVPYA